MVARCPQAGALIDMAAESGGATARDGHQDLEVGPAEPRTVPLDEVRVCAATRRAVGAAPGTSLGPKPSRWGFPMLTNSASLLNYYGSNEKYGHFAIEISAGGLSLPWGLEFSPRLGVLRRQYTDMSKG